MRATDHSAMLVSPPELRKRNGFLPQPAEFVGLIVFVCCKATCSFVQVARVRGELGYTARTIPVCTPIAIASCRFAAPILLRMLSKWN